MHGKASDIASKVPRDRTIALIGMMGAGKSAIGRQLAQLLDFPFVDADREIEQAAGETIPEIFANHGEACFRDGERRVIQRLVEDGPCVLATGGGAYMDERTRAFLRKTATTVWLKADFDVLWRRVSRRSHRPLLRTEDPQGTLRRLIDERYPTYAQADITVFSGDQPKEETVRQVAEALSQWASNEGQAEA